MINDSIVADPETIEAFEFPAQGFDIKDVGMLELRILSGQFHKIPQQLQSDILAFLRMKLRRENVVTPDGRSEGFPIVRSGRGK